MYYVTWSEGFRPGLLNRPGGSSTPDWTYTVPPITNQMKLQTMNLVGKPFSADGQLRFNGSLFMVDIAGLQTTILDPSITNCFSQIMQLMLKSRGLEGDFQYYPNRDG